MNAILRLLLMLLSLSATDQGFAQHDHAMGPKPGTYFGYVKPNGLDAKIPARLDLVIVQNGDEYVHLRATFKLMLGGFQSYEYVTQFYDYVTYSWVRQELTFESNQRELFLANGKVHMMNMNLMIMGDFRSSAGGVTGRVSLIHFPNDDSRSPEELTSTVFPETPVLTSLTGSYTGACEEENYELQLEASKWQGTSGFSTNPLVGYVIAGRLGKQSAQVCGDSDQYCIERPFSDGSYNLYRGKLELAGRLGNLRCTVRNTKILCGPCVFEKNLRLANAVDRVKSYASFEREVNVELGENRPLADFPDPADVEGDFFGFLHHEATNSYQHVRVNVNAFKYTDRPNRPETLYVSANAWLYFGDPNETNEFIGYKFDQRPYLDTAPNFLFEGSGDVFFRVNSWSSTAIVGEWFSKSFGRVGTVQLVRSTGFLNQKEVSLIPSLGGRFQGPRWELDLTVNGNADDFNEGSFYPLRVAGVGRIPELTAAHPITDGTYDFYTNTVVIEMEGQRIGVGQLDGEGINLFWPGKQSWGIPMGLHRFEYFGNIGNDGWN